MTQWNIWLGISVDMQPELVGLVRDGIPAVNFPALNNMADVTKEFFTNTFYDDSTTVFEPWDAGNGKTYKLWSVYATKPSAAQTIRNDLDAIAATYSDDFKLVGFWRTSDGAPLGMDWDDSDPPALVGTVAYPTPAWTINFMPARFDGQTWIPATEITDAHLLAGQAERIFM